MAGIYLHVPLCRQKCAYCDFYSIVNTNIADDFVKAICKEISLQKSYLDGAEIQTIYFGGGTPSILNRIQLEKILKEIYKYFSLGKDPEITIEANPDDLSIEYLKTLMELGFNRLSIGVQSIDDSFLQLMKRKHSAKQAITSVKEAQSVGFKNISVDLIYGLPDLTLKNWENNIDNIIKMNIQHVSAYHLTIEPNTLFYKMNKNKKLNLPVEDESLNQFELLIEKMKENGFLHYEISSFAKDGFISLHNSNYWMNTKYLGLGPSAHSYNLTSRQWNIRNLQGYMSLISQGKIAFERENLTEKEKYNDYVITSLRTMWGINAKIIKKEYGNLFSDYFLRKTESYLEKDLIRRDTNNFILTQKGMFIADNIIESFLYI